LTRQDATDNSNVFILSIEWCPRRDRRTRFGPTTELLPGFAATLARWPLGDYVGAALGAGVFAFDQPAQDEG